MHVTDTCTAFAKATMHKVTGTHAVHFSLYMNVIHSGVLMIQALLKLAKLTVVQHGLRFTRLLLPQTFPDSRL